MILLITPTHPKIYTLRVDDPWTAANANLQKVIDIQ